MVSNVNDFHHVEHQTVENVDITPDVALPSRILEAHLKALNKDSPAYAEQAAVLHTAVKLLNRSENTVALRRALLVSAYRVLKT